MPISSINRSVVTTQLLDENLISPLIEKYYIYLNLDSNITKLDSIYKVKLS